MDMDTEMIILSRRMCKLPRCRAVLLLGAETKLHETLEAFLRGSLQTASSKDIFY